MNFKYRCMPVRQLNNAVVNSRMNTKITPKIPRSSQGARYSNANWNLARSLVALGAVTLMDGCLDRPIGTSTPVTTNVVVERQLNSAITGIDLLLMIDNSSSMADKQTVLAAAVPQLLGQLVQPNCVDSSGNSLNPPQAATLGATNPCPPNSSPNSTQSTISISG